MAVSQGIYMMGRNSVSADNVELNPFKDQQRRQALNLRVFQARTSKAFRQSIFEESNDPTFSDAQQDDISSPQGGTSPENLQTQENGEEFLPTDLKMQMKRKKEMQRMSHKQYEKAQKKQSKVLDINKVLKQIKKFKRLILINDSIQALTGIIGLALAEYEYDDFSSLNDFNRYEENQRGYIVRCFVTILTICLFSLVILVFRHYRLSYKMYRKSGKMIKDVSFYKSPYFKPMLFEMLLFSIHNLPGVSYVFITSSNGRKLRYSINLFVLLIMMSRLFLLVRVITRFTRWRSDQAELICQIEGINSDSVFALKSLLRERPIFILFCVAFICSVIFGFAVRAFEIGYYEDRFEIDGQQINPIPEQWRNYQDYTYQWNGWWLVMTTMSTVGFRDYFPRTHYGRFVIVIASFSGIFLVSLMMVTLNNLKKFSPPQEKSFKILVRIQLRKIVNKLAGLSILAFFRYANAKSKSERDQFNRKYERDLLVFEEALDRHIEQFKHNRFEIGPEKIPQEEYLRVLTEKIEGDIKRIGFKIHNTHKTQNALDDLILNQNQTIGQLKLINNNFETLNQRISQLFTAQRNGPLKVLNMTQYINDQQQEIYEEQTRQMKIKYQQERMKEKSSLSVSKQSCISQFSYNSRSPINNKNGKQFKHGNQLILDNLSSIQEDQEDIQSFRILDSTPNSRVNKVQQIQNNANQYLNTPIKRSQVSFSDLVFTNTKNNLFSIKNQSMSNQSNPTSNHSQNTQNMHKTSLFDQNFSITNDYKQKQQELDYLASQQEYEIIYSRKKSHKNNKNKKIEQNLSKNKQSSLFPDKTHNKIQQQINYNNNNQSHQKIKQNQQQLQQQFTWTSQPTTQDQNLDTNQNLFENNLTDINDLLRRQREQQDDILKLHSKLIIKKSNKNAQNQDGEGNLQSSTMLSQNERHVQRSNSSAFNKSLQNILRAPKS